MRITLASIMVDDQDKALKFYTEVLGFVKKTDMPVGEGFRWLTVVSPQGPGDVELLLEPTGFPPARTYQKALYDAGIPLTSFTVDDIRVGADALSIECGVQIGGSEHSYLIHKPRESSAPQEKKAGMPREQVHDTPERATFLGAAPRPMTSRVPEGRPLAVLFSTTRAMPSERAPGKNVAAGGIAAAFADAFANGGLFARRNIAMAGDADYQWYSHAVFDCLRKPRATCS